MKPAVIGIPRALHFWQYYPLWKTFFEAFGSKVVVSPPTNRNILSLGGQMLADVTCLPVKVYTGHVAWLRDNGQVDAVFVPAIRSVERGAMQCSKFMALPDLMKAAMPDCPPLLELEIDAHRYKVFTEEAYQKLGLQFSSSAVEVQAAWAKAKQVDAVYRDSLVREKLTYLDALAKLYPDEWPLALTPAVKPSPLSIAIAGHPYCLYDDYINHDLVARLRKMGVRILTSEMVSPEQAQQGIEQTTGQKRWFYEDWMSGAAGHYLQDPDIHGVITVLAFTCGPDSAMVETITRRAHAQQRPLMNLVLDEHGSSAGMITRLEAFVDMLVRQDARIPAVPESGTDQITRTMAAPAVLREIHKPRLGFPRMGTSVIPLKSLFRDIGVEVELGPSLSSSTISKGVRYSPEFICTPYKYILGNMVEMLEAGADTLLYMDGAELCRNSSYTQLLNDAMHDMGYKFRLVSTGIFEKGGIFALPQFLRQFMDQFSWSQVLRAIQLGIAKMNVLDELERGVQYLRPRAVVRENVAKAWEEAQQRVDEARCMADLKTAKRDMLKKMRQVEVDPTRQPVRIVTTGEYYAVLEPFFNLDIERVMGYLGAEVHRALMLGNWLKFAMILEALGFQKSKINQAAKPYLRWNIGGEGLDTVGQAVLHARKGFDGLVELLPFTCIPEVTVLNILPSIRRDLNFPTIHFILDEQTGRAGMQTRLEAFIDLLNRRRDLQVEKAGLDRV